MRTSDELDPELAELMRRAAARIPGYPADLATVVRRRRARQRRQGLVTGLAAVAAAAVLVTGAALVRPGSRPDSRPAPPLPSPTARPGPSAQRLFITPVGQSWAGSNGQAVGLTGDTDLGEVLPGGQLATHKVAGLSAVTAAVALPDGGLAALGVPAATPGAAGTPDPSQTRGGDPPLLTLSVLAPDGSPRLLRNGVGFGLVGADEQDVYVYGADGGVSAVDLTTGRQRTLPWGTDVPVAIGGGHAIDLIGDPPGPNPMTCTIRVLDTATGKHLSDTQTPPPNCVRYGGSLSPDGRLLAIVHPAAEDAGTNQMAVVVVDVMTGRQLVSEVVDDSPYASNGGDLVYGGVCWSDADHVRAVWFHLPVPAVRMYTRAETLRQAIVPVPGR